jgi:hypothetical protein
VGRQPDAPSGQRRLRTRRLDHLSTTQASQSQATVTSEAPDEAASTGNSGSSRTAGRPLETVRLIRDDIRTRVEQLLAALT